MFVDTNVLVRARIREAPGHEIARVNLETALEESEPVRNSRQILREYLVVITRPQAWQIPIARAVAIQDVERLASTFQVLEDGPKVTNRLMSLCREVPVGGKQIHDANIVATMLTHGERRPLTFNPADFRSFAGRIELVETA